MAALAWKAGRPYPLDLIAQFGAHAAVATAAGGAFLILWAKLRRRRCRTGCEAGVAALLMTFFALHGAYSASGRLTRGRVNDAAGRMRIVVFNAQGETTRADDAFDEWLRGQDADVVCIIDPPWRFEASRPWIVERFPHHVAPERGLSWSILLLSRHPIEAGPLADQRGENTHSFPARRMTMVRPGEGAPFLFTAVHPPSPRSVALWRKAISEATRDGLVIRGAREETRLPVVVAGDFNSTPTGLVHRAFGRASGLATWATPFGRGTWPARAPAIVALPIDRVWASDDVRLVAARVGPRFRSDHRPVTVDLMMPRLAQEDAGSRSAESPPESATPAD